MESSEPNHVATAVSTGAPSQAGASQRANLLRYAPGQPQGHVESHFLKANAPDGSRALWIKYTVLAPNRSGEPPLAELWAIAFRRGQADPARAIVAAKQSFPLAQAAFGEQPFSIRLPTAQLAHGTASGTVGAAPDGRARLSWSLSYGCPEHEFRPFPARLYTLRFPRSKTLTPAPDSSMHGFFDVDGERWQLDGWPAAQGHNWGEAHADSYAWVHCNAFRAGPGSAPAQRVWLEALTGRVRVGPLRTPWLSCAGISVDGELFRFDGLGAMLSRHVHIDARSYRFTLQQEGARLEARFWAEPSLIAGLCYRDPDGALLSCLNSKLAYGEVVLAARGRTWTLKSDSAALELGTRRADHGINMML